LLLINQLFTIIVSSNDFLCSHTQKIVRVCIFL